MFKQIHLKITLAEALVLMPKYQKMLKALLSNKEKLQELPNTPLNENCSAVILKKLPEKLGDPRKFLIPCGFSELKCKALADLGASINLMPLSVWKSLGLPDLILTRMTLELANRAICTPDRIARDVFVPVGKFTFPDDFVVVDYESDPRVPLILGRPFLRTASALINVYGKEMILHDGDERLTLNMKHDTTSYSNHPYRDSVNLINIFNLSSEDCLEDLVSNKQSGNPTFSLHKEIALLKVIHKFNDSKGCTFLSEELSDINSFNDIHSHFDDDPLSGSTTFSANSLLEEFADELALISYPSDYDDNRTCAIESDIREIEFLLFQGEDSNFKDSIDQSVLTHCDDLFVDPTPEMFTDEQPPDYSFPSRFDVYPNDFLEIESDATFDDNLFDSKREKIEEAKLLIDPLDLPCDILFEYDSFNSQDFSRDDVLPSLDNEDKDFDPPFYELLVFKEVPNSMRLLPFSFENEEKVFKPGIYTSKKFHCCFLSELSHPGAARRWLEKEPPCFVLTWEDLVSKFINEFFPSSRTTNLRNEISNFQQRFDESFYEAWHRYKDLLRACPHHGFTELHQIDTFYNALNPADQDSLNSVAGGNMLERRTQDMLTIIENKSKVRNSRNKSVFSQVKSCDVNSNSSSEIAKLTHAVNQQTSVVTTL
nr:reverse transcriptase domain-containing protein [Tanacetum cinerariifolium]